MGYIEIKKPIFYKDERYIIHLNSYETVYGMPQTYYKIYKGKKKMFSTPVFSGVFYIKMSQDSSNWKEIIECAFKEYEKSLEINKNIRLNKELFNKWNGVIK